MNYPDIKDEILGYLRYNSELDWYESQLFFYETQLSISLSIDDNDNVESALNRASSVIPELKDYAKRAKEYAVEQLLNLKNETWLDEGEALTSEKFKSRMTLEALVFCPEGKVEFYYNDGNLFFGHYILIKMDKYNYFVDASIHG
ncbi:MAG: DUF2262 domain-containing protein [Nostoc sp. DedVER02]|uniref:DUF2262 domain-containing protein n=1 Tax=unclassified Nostoc TaxID=2593658 RepID=UPI002AD56437|nr:MULTISPECIES: DUF2262 domain-containing protein [unclassified Nostoc]MDZ7986809.1 DUF2262 domain-containing protein [Nostoc sp. DedVER02]MDZ8115711.1 DUF2262 domain-containing protein [Nostoc sp. DedVER01b]